jgi:hypothetical protein
VHRRRRGWWWRSKPMKKSRLAFALFGCCLALAIYLAKSAPSVVVGPSQPADFATQPNVVAAQQAPNATTPTTEQTTARASPALATQTLPGMAVQPLPSNLPGAYALLANGQSLEAIHQFDAARMQDADAIAFFSDILGSVCNYRALQEEVGMPLVGAGNKIAKPRQIVEHEVALMQLSLKLCGDYRSRAHSPTELQRMAALLGERGPKEADLPPPQLRRRWNDERVATASTVGQLWRLADGGFKGAAGAQYFGVDPSLSVEYSVGPRSDSLSRAQTIAIIRIRCDMTHACGPEQFDSVLLCARYLQCRPGVSVEDVWHRVASPYELEAAQAIYQIYVALRAHYAQLKR